MFNILVVYGAKSYPLRATTEDHLYCFRRYSGHRCFYFNMLRLRKPWYRSVPSFLRQVSFDLVIFYLDLLQIQWPPYSLESFDAQAGYFREMQAVKVALAQDEFYNTDSLNAFVREYQIDHVFSLAPPSEWPKIYPKVDLEKVRFHRVLPGYLDDKRVAQIERLAKLQNERPISIGYRAIQQQTRLWTGRHGFKKIGMAEVFEKAARQFDLPTDISTRPEDTFLGNAWFKFLLRCKYTIAVEGGASILDHDGSLRRKVEAYVAEHPQADFDEVERACFPGRDGELDYMAISPKHLEACATRTCQILVKGDYNGILLPGRHYLELERDFSNLEQVLSLVQQDHLRLQIVEAAYQDIVASGKYSYRAFVNDILEKALPGTLPKHSQTLDWLWYIVSRAFEIYQWMLLAVLTQLLRFMRRFLPPSVETFLRRLFT